MPDAPATWAVVMTDQNGVPHVKSRHASRKAAQTAMLDRMADEDPESKFDWQVIEVPAARVRPDKT